MTISPSSRLTTVQQDVIDRLADGWTLAGLGGLWSFVLQKPGEPSRHVANATVLSLINRRLIVKSAGAWVLQ